MQALQLKNCCVHTTDKKSGKVTCSMAELMARERDEKLLREKVVKLEILCERYMEVFRANLTDRFHGIEFCDSIEESSDIWYSLKDHIREFSR